MSSFSVKRIFLIAAGFAMVIFAAVIFWVYKQVYAPNTIATNETEYVFIRSTDSYADLISKLEARGVLKNMNSFKWTAEKMKLPLYFKPGKYLIVKGMSNRDLINKIRLGEQVEVNYILKSVRTKEQLAAHTSKYLETDSIELFNLLRDDNFLESIGYNSEIIISMFIPNTYKIKWNTPAKEFIVRMKKESDEFWNDNRLQKANAIGLTKVEVSILASIIEKETSKNDEKRTVAGVYMNRINKGMRLQADPTLIFALNDFGIRRVLNKHKEVDSPYNTYKNVGLPPGPICAPSISSIDAVLDYEKHDFLFFCAKEDFSGYHNFAETYSEHINNANKFQRELDKRKIRS